MCFKGPSLESCDLADGCSPALSCHLSRGAMSGGHRKAFHGIALLALWGLIPWASPAP